MNPTFECRIDRKNTNSPKLTYKWNLNQCIIYKLWLLSSQLPVRDTRTSIIRLWYRLVVAPRQHMAALYQNCNLAIKLEAHPYKVRRMIDITGKLIRRSNTGPLVGEIVASDTSDNIFTLCICMIALTVPNVTVDVYDCHSIAQTLATILVCEKAHIIVNNQIDAATHCYVFCLDNGDDYDIRVIRLHTRNQLKPQF